MAAGDRLAQVDRPWMSSVARERARGTGHYLRGQGLYGLGHLPESLEAFETIESQLDHHVFHEPTANRVIHAMMAEAYLEAGRRDAAVGAYDRLLAATVTDSLEDHFYAGLRALAAGSPEKSLRTSPKAPVYVAGLLRGVRPIGV